MACVDVWLLYSIVVIVRVVVELLSLLPVLLIVIVKGCVCLWSEWSIFYSYCLYATRDHVHGTFKGEASLPQLHLALSILIAVVTSAAFSGIGKRRLGFFPFDFFDCEMFLGELEQELVCV